MNNFFYNQLRRANCALAKKVAMYILATLFPGRVRRAWKKYATDMQNSLNGEHDNYRGWWVVDHEYHYDRSRWTKDGFGCYWPLFE